MAQKRKIQDPSGKLVDGTQVDILESTERFSDVKLEDGTVLRMRVMVHEVARFDDLWDNSGNPMYSVNSATVVVVKEASQTFKKPPSRNPKNPFDVQ
jgi:hypothetical protein